MNNPPSADNGKTTAIVSYITLIGWLIAYFAMHQNNKTSLGSYHLRQTLLLILCAIGFNIIVLIVSITMPWLGSILKLGYIGILILWILGLISAINGEEKPIPLIGERAQTLFPNL